MPAIEELRALPLGNGDGLTIVLLGPGSIAGGIQQIAPHPMQLGFTNRSSVASMICAASARQFSASAGCPSMAWASASHVNSIGVS